MTEKMAYRLAGAALAALIIIMLWGMCNGLTGAVFGNPDTTNDGYIDIRDVIAGYAATPTSSGTLDSITAYILKTAGTTTMKGALYRESDSVLIATTLEKETTHSDAAWVSLEVTGNPSISSGVSYVLVVWAEDTSPTTRLIYDAITGDTFWNKSLTYGSWPNPISTVTETDRTGCMYATYTESAGGAKRFGVLK